MIASASAGLVQRWVRLYTRGLAAEVRDRRREEVDADLWSQLEEATFVGRPVRSTNGEILSRWLLGIPADVTWRIEHRGGDTVTTSAAPLRPALGSTAIGLATAIAGAGLATLLILFIVTSRLVAPANPYYVSGPGVWLVLIGSAAELTLGAALFAFAIRFGDRFHPLVAAVAALGGLVAVVAALGAYTLIAILPVATTAVAWNLVWIRNLPGWVAAVHTASGILFVSLIVRVISQAQSGSSYPDATLLLPAWPLTLVAIGVAMMRRDRPQESSPAI
jgi:hypothetical protein